MLGPMPDAQPISSPPPARVAARRYGAVAMTLHWLLALMIVGSLSVGLYMTGLPFSPQRLATLLMEMKREGCMAMAQAAYRQGRRDANETIADILEKLAATPGTA